MKKKPQAKKVTKKKTGKKITKKSVKKPVIKTKKKTATIEKTTKETKKLIEKAGPKKPEKKKEKPAKTATKETKKPVEKASKKPPEGKKEKHPKAAKKEEKAKKPAKKLKPKTAKKTLPKKTTILKTISKKELKTIAIPKKKATKIPERTIGLDLNISAVKPLPEKKYPVVTVKGKLLPEYREDRITLMVVDPWKIFAYWEVKPDTLAKIKGALVLRIYDVTGVIFDGKNANISFDIAVHERVGDSYIGVRPGRGFFVDIGIIPYIGNFITIARSNRVITPALKEDSSAFNEIYATSPTGGF
ncbi:MAG: DUF4912 domain-containing protein [Nitrospirae bacterium]|nr:DUF4912 domain-containing protein [Nitrospirota bacterium]